MIAGYIFSLGSSSAQIEQQALLGVAYTTLTGRYKGKDERSYLISREQYDVIEYDLLALLREYDQESILYVDERRRAYLHYLDTDLQQPIGTFMRAHPVVALQKDSYTFVPSTGAYYIVRK